MLNLPKRSTPWVKFDFEFISLYIFQQGSLKMCATPGACISETELCSSAAVVPQRKFTELCSSAAVMPHKVNLPSCCVVQRPLCHKVYLPSCVARRPLCHKVYLSSCVARWPLCHKVNLPRCEARRLHFIMTCDIFGTGQTNT